MIKREILDACLSRKMLCKSGAKLLKMHPKAFSRLKSRYQQKGVSALVGCKPGPKKGSDIHNRTPEAIEDTVVHVARQRPDLGPDPLADLLWDFYSIKLNSTTVWRILARKKERYTVEYKRWKKEPTFYCLDQPGEEMQMDGCYPFGRSKQAMSFDAIDDCSRFVFGRCYDRETTANAIAFVKELVVRVPFRLARLRVDNRYGKQFKLFCEQELGIEVIENDPYSPQQNGKVERFHKTLKRSFFWKYCAYTDNLDQLNLKYTQWLVWYNYRRRHRGYGMNKLTPALKIAITTLNQVALNLSFYPQQKVTLSLQPYKT